MSTDRESSKHGESTVATHHITDTPIPVLPLRNTVLFPNLFVPLQVGRPATSAAAEAALAADDKAILIVAQRNPEHEDVQPADLHRYGTYAIIKKARRNDAGIELLVQGIERVEIVAFAQTEPYLKAEVRPAPLAEETSTEIEALQRTLLELAGRILQLSEPNNGVDLSQLVAAHQDPLHFAYLMASLMHLDVAREQAVLEAPTRLQALRLVHEYMTHEAQVLEVRQKIASEANSEMTKQQREYVLRQQLSAIQEELGEKDPEKAEVDELSRRVDETELPDDVRKEARRELGRLRRLPPAAPDHQVIRTYLELVLELPWTRGTDEKIDLPHARQILDEDHFDLHEVKERILEHLAVLKMNPKANAPILCFVGPPGVGKTSLGQSIARALGRRFERLSLGGLHDESELRGHRRTYIGAMPGRIIQAVRRANANNPVIILDEVDKLGRDFRGDPAAALLEILDPAQNATFRDNYLDLPFDLSKVLFITTANTLESIPRPLLDRMEILRLSGYSEEEKVEIARRYLLPRQRSGAGLSEQQLVVADDTVKRIVSRYTREAGVRELERSLGRLARKAARQFAEGRSEPLTIAAGDLSSLLGPERFRHEEARKHLPAGVSTGLAWTEAGGEVLYVEGSLLPNARGLRLTGQLGKVMRESARAARSYIWTHARESGIDPNLFRRTAVHIHVPAGAVPKDGPSAGVAMVTALASLYSDIPARRDTAMTGEITLSGLVLPVGGIKEKVLAARRAGIKRIVLPRDNEKDLQDLPEHVRAEMEFHLVESVEEALAATLSIRTERPLSTSNAA